MKVMALDGRDLDAVYGFSAWLFVIAVVWIFWAVGSDWPAEVAWMTGLLLMMPSSGTRIVLLGLRWVYGYTEGVGGATKRDWSEVGALIVAIADFVLCFGYITFGPQMPALSAFVADFLLQLVVLGVVNVIILVWALRQFWRDYCDWKTVEYHGMFAWDFRTFVRERYAAVERGEVPRF